MPYLGRVYRPYKEGSKDYADQEVVEYLRSIGESPDAYSAYKVVPKTLEGARTALSRYDRHPDPLSPSIKALYHRVSHWLDLEFGPILSDSRVMSLEEVEEWLQHGKAPGYPWSLKYAFKEDYIASNDFDFYAKYWDKLATDNHVPSLVSCFVKVEVREVEKVEANNVRSVSVMDTNHIVAHNQLVLHQNSRLASTPLQSASALGLNMLSHGAEDLIRHMSPDDFGLSPNTIEIDGKKFDSRYWSFILLLVGLFRARMLRASDRTPANEKRMKNLYHELAHAPFVDVDGHVYARDGGNPSGQAATTPDNILKNYMDFAVIWILVTPSEFHHHDIYSRFVRQCIVGDDINLTVKPAVQFYFNPLSIVEKASLIGMQYTLPTMDFRHFHECTFLGHSFLRTYVPSLDAYMYLPVIDCVKMRTNMLIFNDHLGGDRLANTIVRACALRTETFACEGCRSWFADLITFLRARHNPARNPQLRDAWKSYKTDHQLWELYSGFEDRFSSADPTAVPTGLKSQSSRALSIMPTSVARKARFAAGTPSTKKIKEARKERKVAAKVAKAVVTKVTGHGDYRPTSFNRVRGSGDYAESGGSIGHTIGRTVGKVADVASTIFKAITGFGDYRTKGPRGNSLYRHPTGGDLYNQHTFPMKMGAMNVQFAGGPPRVTHRERIASVVAPDPGTFSTKVYRIQPGITGADSCFPWLSSVASCFQQYQAQGIIFEYVSASTEFAAESALGMVMMSTLYDPSATPLATVAAIDNNEFTTTSKPSRDFIHPIECASDQSTVVTRYVRTTNSANDPDNNRLDDIGVFQVTTNGTTAPKGTVLGEVWVTYDILFLKPALPDLHSGATALFWGTLTNLPIESWLLPSPHGSLPVVIRTAHDFTAQLQLPLGYNGSFLVFLVVWGDGPLGVDVTIGDSTGADVTPLGLIRANETGPPYAWTNRLGFRNASGGNASMHLSLWSTIAENEGSNWISIDNMPLQGGSYEVTLGVVGIDSDIVTPSSASSTADDVLRMLVARNPALAALLGPHARRDSLSSMVDLNGLDTTSLPEDGQIDSRAAHSERASTSLGSSITQQLFGARPVLRAASAKK